LRKFLITFICIIAGAVSYGQTFIGTSTDNQQAYTFAMRINKDSSIHFIYNRPNNSVYGEFSGTIRHIQDTLYRITATMTIGQFFMKSFDPDTFYIQLDSNIARKLDKIQVEYSDRNTRKQLQGYDRSGNPISLLKMPIDKKLFNEKKGTNFLTITINRKNFLSDNFLDFAIPFGSAASFTSGQKVDFYVVIQQGQLISAGQPPLQTGHFQLKQVR
jgi:hypothetical protein